MAVVSGKLFVNGEMQAGFALPAEGRPVSECIVEGKANVMELLNEVLAKSAGGAAAAAGEAGACCALARCA